MRLIKAYTVIGVWSHGVPVAVGCVADSHEVMLPDSSDHVEEGAWSAAGYGIDFVAAAADAEAQMRGDLP